MNDCNIDKTKTVSCPCGDDCPLSETLELIGGKWKLLILCILNVNGTSRYGELRRSAKGITNTMLASSLKDLENDGLVIRTQYEEMPVRVEYSLTEASRRLLPILRQLAEWGAGVKKISAE